MRDGSGIYTYPPGTPGVAGQTIFSARYNTFLDDLATTLNTVLPINMGGTGAASAASARDSLKLEMSGQVVTNYDLHNFENGSFSSDAGAIGAPLPARYFTGTCQKLTSDPTHYVTLYARTSDGTTPDVSYSRRMIAGVWQPWVQAGQASTGYGSSYFGNDVADMSYGLTGTAPDSAFFVNSESDATGSNVFMIKKSGPIAIASPNSVISINAQNPATDVDIYLTNSTVPRWLLRSSAATGDFIIGRFNEGGGVVDLPLSIGWVNGQVSLAQHLNAAGSVGAISAVGGVSSISVKNASSSDAAYISLFRTGLFAANLGLDTDNKLKFGGESLGAVAHVIHHEGNSPSAGNYFKFASGMMIVVGLGNNSGNDDAPITFPVAFPTACLGVIVNAFDAATATNVALAYSVRALGPTSFAVSQRYSSAGTSGMAGSSFHYLAWGY